MIWLAIATLIVLLAFGYVLLFGPPYVPTLKPQTKIALDMLNLKSGQTMLELGSGDGRVALAAAKRGWRVVGIELNPFLVIISRIVTWRYRKQVRIIWGSYWQVQWPPADGIFTFMLPRFMTKLDEHVEQWHTKALPLVSFAFKISHKTPAKEQSGVMLYWYK